VYRIAAAEKTLTGEDLESRFDHALRLGFDGIELQAQPDGQFVARCEELAAARAHGVLISSAVVAMPWFIGDFDESRSARAVTEMAAILPVLGKAGAVGLVAPNSYGIFSRKLPPFQVPQDLGECRDRLVKALRTLGAIADGEGVKVLLEPLNRYEDYLVNTLADGASVLAEVDSPGVALTADTYHMSVEETRVGDAIRAHAALIGHVQLGDSNRMEPGHGHYDWADTLCALVDIGYDGWLAMECGLSGSANTVLPGVARLLKRA
jgi:sugar phosphate isomerase/epimerase